MLGWSSASILWGIGQDCQLPGGRELALEHGGNELPSVVAVVFAPRVGGKARASRPGQNSCRGAISKQNPIGVRFDRSSSGVGFAASASGGGLCLRERFWFSAAAQTARAAICHGGGTKHESVDRRSQRRGVAAWKTHWPAAAFTSAESHGR